MNGRSRFCLVAVLSLSAVLTGGGCQGQRVLNPMKRGVGAVTAVDDHLEIEIGSGCYRFISILE